MDKNLIIYDGECGFCNKILLFLAEKDIGNHFTFVSNLSKYGEEILLQNNLTEISKGSIVVIDNREIYTKGNALKVISKYIKVNSFLNNLIQLTNILLLNFVYKTIANNRLKLTNNNCKIPHKEIRIKFIIS